MWQVVTCYCFYYDQLLNSLKRVTIARWSSSSARLQKMGLCNFVGRQNRLSGRSSLTSAEPETDWSVPSGNNKPPEKTFVGSIKVVYPRDIPITCIPCETGLAPLKIKVVVWNNRRHSHDDALKSIPQPKEPGGSPPREPATILSFEAVAGGLVHWCELPRCVYRGERF